MSRSILLFLFWCSTVAAAPLSALPEPLARALQRQGLGTRGLSVYVQDVDNSEPLLAFDADTPRQPASTIKVLTTLAALETLGPAYEWKTEARTAAPIRDGRLEGDLYLKGYGDPYLVIEHFWRLLRQIRQEGITTIAGDLVLDQTYFGDEVADPGEFDGRANRPYNVQPSAFLLNFQAVSFRFIPDVGAKRVRVVTEPWPAHLQLRNDVRLTRQGCRGAWSGGLGLRMSESGGQQIVTVSGTYDAACGERQMFRVVSDALPYIRGVFKSAWEGMGGHFDGQVREAALPANARLLATHDSPALADVIRSVNKFSNNVMTRQLLLTLGAQEAGAPGNSAKGIGVVRHWMQRRGLDFPELVLDHGNGLSRLERISARHLGQVLLAGYHSPSMPEFISSLPISGLDGTMRYRLAGTALEGRVHVKTGAINNVSTIAGYVFDQHDRRVVVVVMHNDPRADGYASDAFQDAVLNWVYSRSADGAR